MKKTYHVKSTIKYLPVGTLQKTRWNILLLLFLSIFPNYVPVHMFADVCFIAKWEVLWCSHQSWIERCHWRSSEIPTHNTRWKHLRTDHGADIQIINAISSRTFWFLARWISYKINEYPLVQDLTDIDRKTV